MPLFSIIIPVYNTRNYLEQCVKSVQDQAFSSCEIILVDDGSTDGSKELCDRLASNDPRIKVIHQVNGGLSSARNSGVDASLGDYIIFLDSDDFWINSDFLEKSSSVIYASSPDMILFNYCRVVEKSDGSFRFGKPRIRFPENNSFDIESQIHSLVSANAYHSSACIKIIARELVRSRRFLPGLLSEDIEWSASFLFSVDKISVISDTVLAYRIREGSITNTVSSKHLQDLIGIIQQMKKNMQSSKCSQERLASYGGYLAFQYCTLLVNIGISPRPTSSQFLKQAKELKELLNLSKDFKSKAIRLLSKIFGITLTIKLLSILYKLSSN